MIRTALAFAMGLSVVVSSACASAESGRRLIFQTIAGSSPTVMVYSDNSIAVVHGSEELFFSNATLTYPRWNGARYRASSNEHHLDLDLRVDRPCAVEGLPNDRTATVHFGLDGRAYEGCGFFTVPQGHGQ